MKLIDLPIALALCLVADCIQAGEPAKPVKSVKAAVPSLQAVTNAATNAATDTAVQTCAASSVAASTGALASTLCSQVADQLTGNAKGTTKDRIGQFGQAAGNQAAAQLGNSISGQFDASDKSLTGQAKAQAAQIVSSQISAQVSAAASGQAPPALGKQLRDQATQAAGGLAATQVSNSLAPVAKKPDTMTQGFFSPAAATMQRGLQQGLSTEVQKRVNMAGAQSEPGLKESLQSAGADALSGSVQQLSQLLPTAQQPLGGDLLMLGVNLQRPVDAGATGSFAPPSQSVLPMGAQGLHTGLNILSNSSGQAGLGVKSDMEIGSQKFEISGTLDPNSNSSAEQGKSVGVQIKIGGN